jgi:hypothetical protein
VRVAFAAVGKISVVSIMCGLLQVRSGIVFELPDEKAQVFLVLIILTR